MMATEREGWGTSGPGFVLQPHARRALRFRYNVLRAQARSDLSSPSLALLMARVDELEELARLLGSTFYFHEECGRWHLRSTSEDEDDEGRDEAG